VGAARKDLPVYKNRNKNGIISYTIALKKADELKITDSLMFDNLFIQENNKGEQRMCVIRYKPEETWYNQSDRSLKNFSGRVELYDLQGRSLGKSTLVNGELAQEKATLAVTECIYEFYMATELLGYTTYNYRLKSCSTTLYGDTGGNNYNNYMDSSSYQGSSWNIGYGEDGRPTTGTGGKDDDDLTSPPLLPLEPRDDEPAVNVYIDESIYEHPCLANVLDAILNCNSELFNETIASFIDNPSYHLTFLVADCPGAASACTDSSMLDSTGNINIKIDDTRQNPINLATDIFHEAIHAEIFRYVKLHHDGIIDPNDKPRLFDYYKHYKLAVEQKNIDHPYMAAYYVIPMAKALRKLDNNQYDVEYYQYFALQGIGTWGIDKNEVIMNNYEKFSSEVSQNFSLKCNSND